MPQRKEAYSAAPDSQYAPMESNAGGIKQP